MQVTNASGAEVKQAGITVTVDVADSCTQFTLRSTPTDATGRATLTGLTFRGKVGAKTIQITSPGLASATRQVSVTGGPSSLTDTVSVLCFGARGDGTTDDAPALQAALESMTDFGGVIDIPDGTYMLGTPHADYFTEKYAVGVRARNVTVHGHGSGSVLMTMPHRKLGILMILADDVTIENLVVDGNNSQRDPGSGYPTGDVVSGLLLGNQRQRITFRDVEARNGLEDGLGCWRCIDLLIERCYTHHNGIVPARGTGISLSGGTRNQAVANRVLHNTSVGIWAAFGVTDVTIQGNTIEHNADGGLQLGGSPWSPPGRDSGYTIVGNTIRFNGSEGYDAIGINGARNGRIESNILDDNYFSAIRLADSPNSTPALPAVPAPSTSWLVQNNSCSATPSIIPHQRTGIRVRDNSSGITLRSNSSLGNGSSLSDQIVVMPPASINADWLQVNTIRWP